MVEFQAEGQTLDRAFPPWVSKFSAFRRVKLASGTFCVISLDLRMGCLWPPQVQALESLPQPDCQRPGPCGEGVG